MCFRDNTQALQRQGAGTFLASGRGQWYAVGPGLQERSWTVSAVVCLSCQVVPLYKCSNSLNTGVTRPQVRHIPYADNLWVPSYTCTPTLGAMGQMQAWKAPFASTVTSTQLLPYCTCLTMPCNLHLTKSDNTTRLKPLYQFRVSTSCQAKTTTHQRSEPNSNRTT